MKAKQTADLENVKKRRELTAAFEKARFVGEKPAKK
jgi:hypothetical protein